MFSNVLSVWDVAFRRGDRYPYHTKKPPRSLSYRSCVGAHDPYCVWSPSRGACVSRRSVTDAEYWQQDLSKCPLPKGSLFCCVYCMNVVCLKMGHLPCFTITSLFVYILKSRKKHFYLKASPIFYRFSFFFCQE